MLAWDIPSEDWDKLTIKTGQFRPGTQELQLLSSCLPSEWFLENVAAKYGPGSYRIQAGPGPYRTKNTTIHVSPAYARDAGYQTAPPMAPPSPDPNQLMAARTAQQALTGPVEPLALAQMIQAAVDTALVRTQPAAQPMNPMEMFFKGMEMANSSMLKSMETAKAMFGVGGAEAIKERDWTDVALELGPSILSTLQQAMKSAPNPAPSTPPPPQAKQTPPPNVATLQTAPPQGAPVAFPEPPQDAIPILQTLRNHAGILQSWHDNPSATEDDLANQLYGLIGVDLEPSVLATADHVAEFGPAILGHISPGFTTTRAAAILASWARLIRSNEETQ